MFVIYFITVCGVFIHLAEWKCPQLLSQVWQAASDCNVHIYSVYSSDAQSRLANERDARQAAESKLLELEKHVNSLAVDYSQLKQKEATLIQDLRAESDKVSECYLTILWPGFTFSINFWSSQMDLTMLNV